MNSRTCAESAASSDALGLSVALGHSVAAAEVSPGNAPGNRCATTTALPSANAPLAIPSERVTTNLKGHRETGAEEDEEEEDEDEGGAPW